MQAPRVRSLVGIQLRCEFAAVAANFGEPETVDYSPQDEGARFGTYSWASRGVSVLTWLTDAGELVWGVRLDGPGSSDPVLGFGVGSARKDVLECLPPGWTENDGVIAIPIDDDHLMIVFKEDRVSSIRLMAPMG
ncbi:MAG: hypothetical protein HGA24_01050 [Candidatus Aminicenantes bacterium]|nr:hypothetical protein [Candidatus Aminicenantes bacterium]